MLLLLYKCYYYYNLLFLLKLFVILKYVQDYAIPTPTLTAKCSQITWFTGGPSISRRADAFKGLTSHVLGADASILTWVTATRSHVYRKRFFTNVENHFRKTFVMMQKGIGTFFAREFLFHTTIIIIIVIMITIMTQVIKQWPNGKWNLQDDLVGLIKKIE